MNSNLLREILIVDYVFTRLRRSLLKWIGFSLLFTLVTFCYGSLFFFSDVLEKNVDIWLKNSPDMVVQMQRGGRQIDVDIDILTSITRIRGVAGGIGRLWGYYYDSRTHTAYTVIAPDETISSGQAAIGQGIARLWQLEEGDDISFNDAKNNQFLFNIRTIFPQETEMVSSDLIQISPTDFRNLFQIQDGMATDLAIFAPRKVERTNIARKIKELYPASRVIIREDLHNTYTMIFGWRTSIFIIISLVGLFALLTFAIDQFSGLWSGERKEIALLRSLGWSTTMVIRSRLYEVGVVLLFSWLWGAAIAWCHIFLLGGGLISKILRGWSTIFPEAGFYPMLDFGSLGLLFCITVIPLLSVALLPIWKIAGTDPEAF